MTKLVSMVLAAAVWTVGCTAPTHGFADAGSDLAADGHACVANADCDDHTACTRDLCLLGGVCSNTPSAGACDGGTCVSGTGCVAGGMACTSNTQCNDHVECTADACLVDGTCLHTPNDNLCPPGQRCTPAGCVAACATATDCDDHFDCTLDVCQSSGQCLHTAQNNRCTPPQVCAAGIGCAMPSSCGSDPQCDNHVYCDGMERCNPELACVAGTAVDCNDMNPCTTDACSETTHGCTHAMDPACTMNVHSGIFSISPAPMYTCAYGAFHLGVASMMFTVSGGRLTVMGAPATMSSAAPAGASFDVSGINMGACEEHYQLVGMLTDPTHFAATFTVSFVDTMGIGACFDCVTQSFTVTGTGT